MFQRVTKNKSLSPWRESLSSDLVNLRLYYTFLQSHLWKSNCFIAASGTRNKVQSDFFHTALPFSQNCYTVKEILLPTACVIRDFRYRVHFFFCSPTFYCEHLKQFWFMTVSSTLKQHTPNKQREDVTVEDFDIIPKNSQCYFLYSNSFNYYKDFCKG